MYPLDFPLRVLREGRPKKWVLDPFCGRGTTNYAARLLGMNTVGIDASPIAVAVASAKLVRTSSEEVVKEAKRVLSSKGDVAVPEGPFWERAYHTNTLADICRLREAFGVKPQTAAQVVLRALIMGLLHGPLTKTQPSYLSNQCPRTFAPKPAYAVRFWKKHHLRPRPVDTLELIERRTKHCLLSLPRQVDGYIRRGDARHSTVFQSAPRFAWIITSPPYYGMRTYVPDQWLRNWFVGGPPLVVYNQPASELAHNCPQSFAQQLRQVWWNLEQVCFGDARLIFRFGGINDRNIDALELAKTSLQGTSWRIVTIKDAGTAYNGKRQASQFGARGKSTPRREYDVYARIAD
jgi:hypothetical protein